MHEFTAAEKALLAQIAAAARRNPKTPERAAELDALFSAIRFARLQDRLAETTDHKGPSDDRV
jgi:hypothetical protein